MDVHRTQNEWIPAEMFLVRPVFPTWDASSLFHQNKSINESGGDQSGCKYPIQKEILWRITSSTPGVAFDSPIQWNTILFNKKRNPHLQEIRRFQSMEKNKKDVNRIYCPDKKTHKQIRHGVRDTETPLTHSQRDRNTRSRRKKLIKCELLIKKGNVQQQSTS